MKNIIKSKFLDATQRRLRNMSLSSNEGGGGGSEQQQQAHRQKRPSKKYFRQQEPKQQQLQQKHRQRSPSHLREESRSDSKSPHYRHQHQHQQQQRDSGVRDLFQFQNSSSQQHQQAPPQISIQQPRDQAVFRNPGYSAQQQLQSTYGREQQHFYSSHPHQQQQHYQQHYHHQQQHEHHSRPSHRVVRNESSSKRRQYSNPFLSSQQEHEHNQHQQQLYQQDYADKFGRNMALSQTVSPLSLSGVPSTGSPVHFHFRPRQQQIHHHEQQQAQFDFGSKNNLCAHDEDNCRVRFLSSSSSVSSSFSEEPSQVHMMAGGGQSVASSCMSAGSSYLLDSGSKRNSKSDLAIFDKVMRSVVNEENERLCAMGMASINQDGTTSAPDSSTQAGRTPPEHQWETPMVLPRMNSQNNEEFELEVSIESEYHDFGDDEVIHHQYASPLSASPVKRGSAATTRVAATNKVALSGSRSPFNSARGRNQKSEKEEEFGMATFSQWSSSYFG